MSAIVFGPIRKIVKKKNLESDQDFTNSEDEVLQMYEMKFQVFITDFLLIPLLTVKTYSIRGFVC